MKIRLSCLFVAMLSVANASIIISGDGPFGTLTAAVVNTATPGSVFSQYSRTFDVTITGVPTGDLGGLYFAVDETARPFFGGPAFEEMNSSSSLNVQYTYPFFPGGIGSFSLGTPAFLPNGSTPISCFGPATGQCAANVAFGVEQQMTFTALSSVSYGFFPATPQTVPSLSGSIESSVTIERLLWIRDITTNTLLDNATVTFSSAPARNARLFFPTELLISARCSRLKGLPLRSSMAPWLPSATRPRIHSPATR